MTKKFFIFLIIVSLFVGFGIAGEAKAGPEHNVYGWAWGGVPQAVAPEKLGLGWINFNNISAALPTLFGTFSIYSVAYGNDKFIAVGTGAFSNSGAYYSYDGISWSSINIEFGSVFYAYSVTYGNGRFVVVGREGKASYSDDGITWTSLPRGTTTGIRFQTYDANSVTYGNGRFVVVGQGGKASHSDDGITWTSLTPGAATGIKFGIVSSAQSVTYGNDKFVVVGQRGKASYSDDGITWTSLPPGEDTGIKFGTSIFDDANSVTYGNGRFVVVGKFGKASYSSDGITWTSLPPGATTGIRFQTYDAYSVTYGNGRFVVVGMWGKASYSDDGITWSNTGGSINYGVDIDADTGLFSGYAYFDMNDPNTGVNEIGWIDFAPASPYPTCPGTTCPDGSPDYSVCLDLPGAGQVCDGAGDWTVTGWARALNYDGGWDGWILLGPIVKGGTDYGVYIDTALSPAEFKNWAWGSDVVGWVSFNRSNTGAGVDYKVMTTLVINPPPSATNLDVVETTGCDSGSDPDIFLGWTFNDPGDTQSAYQIQIDEDSSFSSPRGCPNAGDTKVINSGGSCSPVGLSFSTQYWWRLKVWDSINQESVWINYNNPADPDGDGNPATFTTDSRWPAPDFLCDGESCVGFNTRVNQLVNFDNTTAFCGVGGCNYEWDFDGDSSPEYTSEDVIHTFLEADNYNVTLKATNTAGACVRSYSVGVDIALPRPKWREIAPTF